MARLRLIAEAHAQLKQDDPGTAITLCGLRRMVKAGDIPVIRMGKKFLINYDWLLQYLQTGSCNSDPVTPMELGTIRKIS